MYMVDQLPCGSVLTPAISCTKFKIHSAHADSPLTKILFLFVFQSWGRTSLCFTDQETQEENVHGGQLPCGSVLTPAISCTKFKIHSAHADSPLTKTLFLSFHFWGRTSLCFTDQETQEENVHGGPTPLWVSSYTSYLLYKVQDPFSAWYCFFFFQSWGRTSLCFTDHETQEENVHGGQLPCGSVLTPAISFTKFKIHSAHAAKTLFLSSQFWGRTTLCFTDQETQEENVHGGPTPLWVSTYTSYLLYKVQDPFSACRQSINQNIVCFFSILREDQSLLHRPRNSRRECAWWTNILVGQYYTSYLLYKAQNPFSICRPSIKNTFLWPTF